MFSRKPSVKKMTLQEVRAELMDNRITNAAGGDARDIICQAASVIGSGLVGAFAAAAGEVSGTAGYVVGLAAYVVGASVRAYKNDKRQDALINRLRHKRNDIG